MTDMTYDILTHLGPLCYNFSWLATNTLMQGSFSDRGVRSPAAACGRGEAKERGFVLSAPLITTEDKKLYAERMAENLPMLRSKLGLSQTELGQLIGVSRQTISAFESKTRVMPWQNFTSLLFIFHENTGTKNLLPILGIYTPELMCIFRTTDLNRLSKE